ncbi:hypothetical protein CKO12_08880 [Chromatium okenii]|uniref:hypothetical protein n=1 Tax=Chromatium okenii TaxID=61644 RepID=UPI001908DEA9|nr:hypothetical protein [Chromatium okenii]MBK1641982.1 hypothetical protein [Chromatium okenii]
MAHLLRWVTTAVRELPAPMPLIPPPPPPTLLLLGGEPDVEATLRQAMTAALGADWALDTQPLSAAATLNPALYGVIVILQHTFSTRNSVREALAQVLAAAPCPQIIVCCDGRDELRPSILYLANHHPFRLLDLMQPQWALHLQSALQEACLWYGQTEIQLADADALQRMHLILPEDFGLEDGDDLFDEYDEGASGIDDAADERGNDAP